MAETTGCRRRGGAAAVGGRRRLAIPARQASGALPCQWVGGLRLSESDRDQESTLEVPAAPRNSPALRGAEQGGG